MSRTIEKTVFKFDELSDRAKEKARDWYRDDAFDYDWYTFLYEDLAIIFDILGIDSRKPVKLMNGTTRYDPCIWFSGFSSQGDGACFEGTYRYAKGASKKIREHAPQDEKLHAIADLLTEVQRRHFYRLEARVTHSGHYYHEGCTTIDVTDRESGDDIGGETEKEVAEQLRALMRWIYRALQDEYRYLNSNEAIDESIDATGYEFYEDGSRADI